MPTIHREKGYLFHFRAGEVLEEPAHIHVEGEKGSMKVWLNEDLEIAYSSLSAHEEKKVLKIIKTHYDKMKRVWQECESRAK